MRYSIEEIMKMSQEELSAIVETEKKNGVKDCDSVLNVGFGNMSIEEIAQKYGLTPWEDVKNEIIGEFEKAAARKG